MRKISLFLLPILLIGLIAPIFIFTQPVEAAGWYNTSWAYRMKITFNNTDSAENLGYFPVMVHLDDSNANWTALQNDGDDVRFTDSDGTTLLTAELVDWDDTNDAWMYVNVTQVDAGSSTDYMYMYYGNATVPSYWDAANTWRSEYIAVWHFEEDAGTIYDSTDNDVDSTSEVDVAYNSTGVVGNCLTYDGNDYLDFGDNANLEFTTAGFTFECFTNMDDVSNDDNNLLTKSDSAPNLEYVWQIEDDGYMRTLISNDGSNWGANHDDSGVGGGAFQDDTWYYAAVSWDHVNIVNYANGAVCNPNPSIAYNGDIATTGANAHVGANDALSHFITGEIDEMRVAEGAWSADWIEASYKTNAEKFLTFGAEEAPAAGPDVRTDAITGFGHSWAVGKGTITNNQGNTVTVIGIDYGLTSGYGSSQTEIVSIASNTTFSVRIDGLTPATEYHWRVKAYTANGWGYGSDAIFHTSGSDTLYEYFSTGDDADVDIYGTAWFGQTFTTNATVPHTITQVVARLFKVGDPGTLTAHVYRTSGGVPTGLELTSGDIDGDALSTNTSGLWYNIELDEEVALQTGTVYAIVLDAQDGDGSNYVSWRVDTGNGYASGTEVTSTNGGTSYSAVGANDLMFEIWGNPAILILDAKAFENLIEDGDQLFVYSYQVIVSEDYSDDLPSFYFNTGLYVGSTLEAQSKLPAWGYYPGGFYLSADEAIPWGSNLTTIEISGITGSDFDGDEAQYILSSTDWVGEDLHSLDDWIIATANAIGTWYGTTFTSVSGSGHAFVNPDGTVVFLLGIPGIDEIRPGVFSVQEPSDAPDEEEYDTSYAEGLRGQLGETWVNMTEELGTFLGVDDMLVGSTLWIFLAVMGIAAAGTVMGHGPITLITAGLPLIFLGGSFGAVPLEYILLPVFVLGVIAILKLTGVKGG